jgi:hypothetical protein
MVESTLGPRGRARRQHHPVEAVEAAEKSQDWSVGAFEMTSLTLIRRRGVSLPCQPVPRDATLRVRERNFVN